MPLVGLDGAPTTDVFPVSISVHNRVTGPNCTIAGVYALLAGLILLRQLIPNWRPTPGHRRIAYWMVMAMCLFRVAMFVLFADISHEQPVSTTYGSQPAFWQVAMSADVCSMLAWACFCAAVFALGYSWSGRIPCVYCMIQFSDEPTWWKGGALYLIPSLLTALSAVSSPLRLITSHTLEKRRGDFPNFVRATFIGRASAAAAVAFAACFVIVVPYTAYIRHLARQRHRQEGIDHVAIAAMVRKSTLQRDTDANDHPAVVFLGTLGLLMLWQSLYRLIFLQTTLHPVDTDAWVRGQVAVYIMVVIPEWLATLAVLSIDDRDLQHGNVTFWRPWQAPRNLTPEHPLLALHSLAAVTESALETLQSESVFTNSIYTHNNPSSIEQHQVLQPYNYASSQALPYQHSQLYQHSQRYQHSNPYQNSQAYQSSQALPYQNSHAYQSSQALPLYQQSQA